VTGFYTYLQPIRVTPGVALTGTPDEGEAAPLLLLRQELTAKEERLTALQEEREREHRQLTALLTDQSRGEKGASVPDAALPSRRRFFRYLRLWRH